MTHTHVFLRGSSVFSKNSIFRAPSVPSQPPRFRGQAVHPTVPKLPLATVFEGDDVRPLSICERLGGGRS